MKLHFLENRKQGGFVTFGIPWKQGELQEETAVTLTVNGEQQALQKRTMAYWPDGSVKWLGVCADVDGQAEEICLEKEAGCEAIYSGEQKERQNGSRTETQTGKKEEERTAIRDKQKEIRGKEIRISEEEKRIVIDTGVLTAKIARSGKQIFTEVLQEGKNRISGASLLLLLEERSEGDIEGFRDASLFEEKKTVPYIGVIENAVMEEAGKLKTVVRLSGYHQNEKTGRSVFPFILRLEFHAGEEKMRLMHTFLFDGDEKKDFMKGLGIRFEVPMKGALYNRHVKLGGDYAYFHEALQLLLSWRPKLKPEIYQAQIEGKQVSFAEEPDDTYQRALNDITVWSNYHLYQGSASNYRIIKRTNHEECCYIQALEGKHAKGIGAAADEEGGLIVGLRNFREKYPSALWFDYLDTDKAEITAWIWSPESEPMDFRHYDTKGHASAYYEGFDEVGATPYGIANTNELLVYPFLKEQISGNLAFQGEEEKAFAAAEKIILSDKELDDLWLELQKPAVLLAQPEYYHAVKAFGEWSLPSADTPLKCWFEKQLDGAVKFYKKEVEARNWYGMFHYGDFMHTYDKTRHSWRYDMGGYAWQNTELVPTLWLWYAFLRSGREDIFALAEAMSRHCADVDVYHIGPFKGIGSRHNVRHWGCSCKEARIAMAGHHRMFYYLTGDARMQDVFDDVKDGDFAALNMDPLRYFYDKDKMVYPTHARSGPDWSTYTSNWLTEWERHNNTVYRDKILTGIADIKKAPLQLVSGSDYEYNPKDSHLRYIGEKAAGGSHLAICMGGPQTWFELADLIEDEEWKKMLADYGVVYFAEPEERREMTKGLLGKREFSYPFMAAGIGAWAARYYQNPELGRKVWTSFFDELKAECEKEGFCMKDIGSIVTEEHYQEIPWISTNVTAQWCLNAIVCLELAKEFMPADMPEME